MDTLRIRENEREERRSLGTFANKKLLSHLVQCYSKLIIISNNRVIVKLRIKTSLVVNWWLVTSSQTAKVGGFHARLWSEKASHHLPIANPDQVRHNSNPKTDGFIWTVSWMKDKSFEAVFFTDSPFSARQIWLHTRTCASALKSTLEEHVITNSFVYHYFVCVEQLAVSRSDPYFRSFNRQARSKTLAHTYAQACMCEHADNTPELIGAWAHTAVCSLMC